MYMYMYRWLALVLWFGFYQHDYRLGSIHVKIAWNYQEHVPHCISHHCKKTSQCPIQVLITTITTNNNKLILLLVVLVIVVQED